MLELRAAGQSAVGNAAASVGGGAGVARAAESVLAVVAVAGTVYVVYEGYRYLQP